MGFMSLSMIVTVTLAVTPICAPIGLKVIVNVSSPRREGRQRAEHNRLACFTRGETECSCCRAVVAPLGSHSVDKATACSPAVSAVAKLTVAGPATSPSRVTAIFTAPPPSLTADVTEVNFTAFFLVAVNVRIDCSSVQVSKFEQMALAH